MPLPQRIRMEVAQGWLEGDLVEVPRARGLVLFVEGGPGVHRSSRNLRVGDWLHDAGFSTLIPDLLTRDEGRKDLMNGDVRFDVDLLAARTLSAIEWIGQRPRLRTLPLGVFSAGTGTPAALCAAADHPDKIGAIVSRGGRPDLARKILSRVITPTLLIVGGDDHPVIELNQEALNTMAGERLLALVPGASHLFEQPGALDEVGRMAVEWYEGQLAFAERYQAR